MGFTDSSKSRGECNSTDHKPDNDQDSPEQAEKGDEMLTDEIFKKLSHKYVEELLLDDEIFKRVKDKREKRNPSTAKGRSADESVNLSANVIVEEPTQEILKPTVWFGWFGSA